MHGRPWNRCALEGSRCCCNAAITEVGMSFAKGTDTNPYITEPGNISPNKDLEY